MDNCGSPLLSLVLPVYKAEAYLRRCLDSIFNAGMVGGQIEVIAVDDASPFWSHTPPSTLNCGSCATFRTRASAPLATTDCRPRTDATSGSSTTTTPCTPRISPSSSTSCNTATPRSSPSTSPSSATIVPTTASRPLTSAQPFKASAGATSSSRSASTSHPGTKSCGATFC